MVTQVPVCYRWGTAATAGVDTNEEDGSMIHCNCVQNKTKRKVFREREEMVRLEEKENVDKEEKVFCVQSLFKFQFNIESPA